MIVQWAGATLFIGGKSMGGRMASMVADESDVAGLVCLGYPFHPSGKPERLRIDHLRSLQTPSLFVQGERDALGNRATVSSLELSSKIRFEWLPDGDHSFKPRKSSGHSTEDNWARAMAAIDTFCSRIRL
jgi:predicted alpha/beta-hydrolase family hydrolase